MSRTSKIFGCAFFLISCSIENRIIGTYLSQDSSPLSFEKIDVSKEGLFTVSSWSDVAGEFTTTGTWKLIGDTLLLKSGKSRFIKSYQYNYDSAINGTRIEIRWKSDSTLNPFTNVFLNENKIPLDSVKKGIFISDMETIRSVRIVSLGDYIDVPKPNGNANVLIYYWELAGESSVDVGTKWKLKNGKLYPLETGYSIFKKKK